MKELKIRRDEQTDSLRHTNECLLAETSEHVGVASAIRDSEEQLRSLADAMPLLVWRAGPDKLCNYVSQGWLEFTGRTIEQELGNGWAENVHPADLRQCLDIYTSSFDRREPFLAEYRLRHHSGQYRWVLDRGVPQVSLDGTFLGYIGSVLDTHDHKLTQQLVLRSRQELRALAVRLQRVREEEKAHLAREIHDELSGALTALKMDLSLLPDRVAKDRSLFLEKLHSMSELIDHTLARIQSIATALRPVVLDKLGLIAAIEWQAGGFQDHSGIACESHLPDEDLPLDSDRSTAVFRILQEALTNVARHANATKVVVELKSEAKDLILTVQDNGKGIDEQAIRAHGSMGLLGMRERALAFGGAAEVAALPAGGTLVSLRIPIA